ncbi:MAG: DUF5683 domain-containing protein [Sediminibacterium sp.]|jgi:Family of unknown function (DUF5683)
MKAYQFLIWLFFLCTIWGKSLSQSDTNRSTIKTVAIVAKDSAIKKHDPRKATRRSAIIPGWGQAYNKEYWKIPIAYGVIAIPVSLYFYNNSWYKKTKFAYEAKYKAEVNKDSTDLNLMDPLLKQLSSNSLQSYRNSFRRDRDYSILWFIAAWGLNVIDATVFGHLKDFDVSNDLTMNVKPQFNPINRSTGFALTVNMKKNEHKLYTLP